MRSRREYTALASLIGSIRTVYTGVNDPELTGRKKLPYRQPIRWMRCNNQYTNCMVAGSGEVGPASSASTVTSSDSQHPVDQRGRQQRAHEEREHLPREVFNVAPRAGARPTRRRSGTSHRWPAVPPCRRAAVGRRRHRFCRRGGWFVRCAARFGNNHATSSTTYRRHRREHCPRGWRQAAARRPSACRMHTVRSPVAEREPARSCRSMRAPVRGLGNLVAGRPDHSLRLRRLGECSGLHSIPSAWNSQRIDHPGGQRLVDCGSLDRNRAHLEQFVDRDLVGLRQTPDLGHPVEEARKYSVTCNGSPVTSFTLATKRWTFTVWKFDGTYGVGVPQLQVAANDAGPTSSAAAGVAIRDLRIARVSTRG